MGGLQEDSNCKLAALRPCRYDKRKISGKAHVQLSFLFKPLRINQVHNKVHLDGNNEHERFLIKPASSGESTLLIACAAIVLLELVFT